MSNDIFAYGSLTRICYVNDPPPWQLCDCKFFNLLYFALVVLFESPGRMKPSNIFVFELSLKVPKLIEL